MNQKVFFVFKIEFLVKEKSIWLLYKLLDEDSKKKILFLEINQFLDTNLNLLTEFYSKVYFK